MAAPPAPRALTEVLIGEIIHRLPPDNPACLFRASAVCGAWRAFVTNDKVIRRYREFHQAPPVLGLLQNRRPANEPVLLQPHFLATATPPPPINLPNIQGVHQLVLDCRHGRVLVHTIGPLGLIVCNPITGEQQVLPDYPPLPSTDFSGAVLCAVDGCHHLDCRGGAFRVVFMATNAEANEHIDAGFTWVSLYSSETGVWTEPMGVFPGPPMMNSPNDLMGPSLLAGDAVYFTLDLQNTRAILRYDWGGEAAPFVMNAPPLVRTRRDTFLVTGEDGGLGIAAVENYRLRLWSWFEGVWAPWRDIDLEKMLPLNIGCPTTEFKVIGFAEMSGVIFVMANGIVLSTLELKSGEIREVKETLDSSTIFPFESFYTPARICSLPHL